MSLQRPWNEIEPSSVQVSLTRSPSPPPVRQIPTANTSSTALNGLGKDLDQVTSPAMRQPIKKKVPTQPPESDTSKPSPENPIFNERSIRNLVAFGQTNRRSWRRVLCLFATFLLWALGLGAVIVLAVLILRGVSIQDIQSLFE